MNKQEERRVPYIVYEGAMARAERHAKRLCVAIIILSATLLTSNGAWLFRSPKRRASE